MEEKLQEVLEQLLQTEEAEELGIESVSTYEEAGILTYDKGLVIRTATGEEFQVSIVQSR